MRALSFGIRWKESVQKSVNSLKKVNSREAVLMVSLLYIGIVIKGK